MIYPRDGAASPPHPDPSGDIKRNFEIYANRKKRLEQAGQVEVYQYDSLPKPFRVQVTYILNDALGEHNPGWELIRNTLCRELGLTLLAQPAEYMPRLDADEECLDFLRNADTDRVLSLIELGFRYIDLVVRDFSSYDKAREKITQDADSAIEELNRRFQEHSLGYQYVGHRIVRVDSRYLHEEAVKPAIALLHEMGFEGPSDEFMDAHEHYRHGRYEEAINDALKAFESTMKAICDARGWPWGERAAARELINIILTNNLVPTYMQTHLSGLRQTLESGLPTVRNKESGHGQGPEAVTVRDYTAAYALHLAASNIVLLVEAHREKPVK